MSPPRSAPITAIVDATRSRLAPLPVASILLAVLGTHACFFEPEGFPVTPVLRLEVSSIKQFDFSWSFDERAEYYQLFERADPAGEYLQLGDDVLDASISLTVPLHLRFDASYILRACNSIGCVDSAAVVPTDVAGPLAEAVGYFKAASPGENDLFGAVLALSRDGNTLAVGVPWENSSARGINGDDTDEGAVDAGAVYVFVRSGSSWSQQAYIKASNAESKDYFGWGLSLSTDGNVLAVGAPYENSAALGTTGGELEQDDNEAANAGAVYLFERSGTTWAQHAYLKASNTDVGDLFGTSVALSGDGRTLAVGADWEDSNGAMNNQENDPMTSASGAVYVFTRDSSWKQQSYIKASAPSINAAFGQAISLSEDGNTLAVGASGEADAAGGAYVFVRNDEDWLEETHIPAPKARAGGHFGFSVALSGDGGTLAVGSDEEDVGPGAAHVFERSDGDWQEAAYIEAENAQEGDRFGYCVALSHDGSILAVGAIWEDGQLVGVNGASIDNDSLSDVGAVYLYERRSGDHGWLPRAYIKAPNSDANDLFGRAIALSRSGDVLAVGAHWEASSASGVQGNQANDAVVGAGAVYLY